MSTALNVTRIRGHIPQWTFAERARKVRRDLGLTQQQMADQIEVGLKAYSAWESGKNSPEDIAGIAVKFEGVSGVPRTWFLGWADDGPSPVGGGTNLVGVGSFRRRLVLLPGLDSNQEPIGSTPKVIDLDEWRDKRGA